jgi:hypothetical protein
MAFREIAAGRLKALRGRPQVANYDRERQSLARVAPDNPIGLKRKLGRKRAGPTGAE